MSYEEYALISFTVLIVVLLGILVFWKAPKKVKHDKFYDKWKKVQDKCKDESLWPMAIIEADNLLGEGLKRKRFKGKNIGERMVSAQKSFSNNDAVWFGHKLRTKLEINPDLKLTKQDVQKALVGLRQGLKDIGVLR